MTAKIFYFSGTGNTLKIAKDLADQLDNAQLVRISYEMEFDQTGCDAAGIAYPVYCFGLPNIVMNFLSKVKFSDTAYIFGLASYGGLLASSGRLLKSTLKKRGYTLNAGFAINMPGNATTVYDVPKAGKREAMYSKESSRIAQIASVVKNRESCGIDANLGLLGRLASAAAGSMMSKMNESDKSFFVDESCNGCSICENVCPVGNIKMVNGKPQWQHGCEGCMACFHWCPNASIQGSKKTKERGRYHHPEVTLEQMLGKQPEKA
ncbi:MAG: EFR1 family ferrodoxin [Chitinispirillaceae bacterium]